MVTECDKLVGSYLSWLKDRITVAEIDGVCEITTPFLDRHNDRLQIYVQPQHGRLRLSDDGYIIADLEMCGCAVDSPHRREMLQTILSGFGVREEKGELVIEANDNDFAKKKHSLLQAMMAVNDMFMTAQRRVTYLFFEDVGRFLEEKQVRYIHNVEFTGRSGFVHKYDFVIPRSQSKPERILRAINDPTRERATSVIFSWTDTKDVRPPGSSAYAILNDLERAPSSDVLSAFAQYGISSVSWSERDQYVNEFID